jgi:hypothetical protein
MSPTKKTKRSAAAEAAEARCKRYERDVCDWTDAELDLELTERYAPTKIPPCRVCGGELWITSVGGGRPTVWACSPMETDPANEELSRLKTGREYGDTHYSESHYEDRRQGGDELVIELLTRFKRLAVAEDPLTPR